MVGISFVTSTSHTAHANTAECILLVLLVLQLVFFTFLHVCMYVSTGDRFTSPLS